MFVPEGLVVPCPAGLIANETMYWVFQFQAIVEGAPMVNVTADDVPVAGTLPVPVQPVQTY
jgi:hypothetical protein